MEAFRNIFNKVQCFSKHLIAVCMVVMMTVIFVQTMTRYVVFYSIPWSEELSRYLYVTLTLMGVNLAVTSKQLVRIDIIDNFVKGNTLNVIRCALAFVITVIFFYSSFGMIDVSQYQHSPALGISMQIMYVILGIGFLMSAVACLFELVDALKDGNKQGSEE
ncbi:TRAP transporter small permease [uncultured Succinatimonas sp.]|uniref:TRAP transporter small permease n=1 Tax=uncultured Succinatimonas sp. TaxID=1262973 RepID=UPI0025DA9A86|nr:TRAP transporter small permease [uncultured Succinatimonas sp.]